MGLPKIQYSRLRFYHFVDEEDQELGTLEDVILDSQTLIPTHIILGGGFFEEFLEDKGEIEDIDEIAPLTLIDHIDNDFIVLSTKLEELETTNKNGELPINGYKYTKFAKFQIADNNGILDAEIFDFEFNGESSAIMINHTSLGEELRKQNYFQKFEVIVPVSMTSVDGDILTIDITNEELIEIVKQQTQPKDTGRSRIVLSE